MRDTAVVNLRVFATLIVVLGHSIIIFDPGWSSIFGYTHDYPSELLYGLKRVINLFQMPLFFAISGYCFYWSVSKVKSLAEFYRNKALRLLLPFLLIAFLWVVPLRFVAQFQPYQSQTIGEIAMNVLTVKDSGHLWFLPTLFLCFVLAIPVVRLSVRKGLLAVVAVIIMAAVGLFIPNSLIRGTLTVYFPAFMTGYLLNCVNWRGQRRQMIAVVVMTIALLAGICWFFTRASLTLTLFGFAIVLMVFALMPSKTHPVIQYLDRNSFGIYLFHCPILYLGMCYLSFLPPPIYLILQLLTSISISLLMIKITRKLGWNYVIGESPAKPKMKIIQ